MNLGRLIERNADCYGGNPAIVFEGGTTTYRQFRNRVVALVNALHARGLDRQHRMAILSQNRPEYLEAYGAAEMGGYIALGLNYRLSGLEQAEILRDGEPSAFVFEAQYTSRVESLRAQLPASMIYVCIGDAPPWAVSYELLLEGASVDEPSVRALDEDIAYLLYTSGSTGRPKGVMLGNAAQYRQAVMLALAHSSQQDDRMEVVMPLYHIGGLTEHHSFAVVGATTYLHRAFNAVAVLDAIAAHRSTAVHLAPVMVQRIVDVLDTRPTDVSSLRTVIYASAPMSVTLLKRALEHFGPVFTQVYGMTEGTISTLLRHQHMPSGSEHEVARLASGGQACAGVDVKIIRENGEQAALNETGEICIRSDALFAGYWRDDDATAKAFSGEWFRTGDIGYLDDDHFLFIVDRKKDMIVSGGENIYSREVEEAIMRHPHVYEAAVIGVPDESWGESVKAFVVRRPGTDLSEAHVLEHCRAQIASYKKPRSVEFVEALPRKLSTDKVDKLELRRRFWSKKERLVS